MSDTVDRENWLAVKTLFAAVCDEPPEQQEHLLASAATPEIASEVRRLLAHVKPSGVLDFGALASVTHEAAIVAESLVGRTVGPYKVVREIGRGGMGTVYLAARVDGEFEQQVAIKTLRLGVSSAAISARFRQERQILAALQHPHIAGLLDGGVTADGVPYLVLEYIDGIPIDTYCDQHQLSVARRIDLFRDVLDAVGYAHRQLVVHRDIKPNNILVTRDGVVKLVDFGIAKLLGATDGQATIEGWQAFTTGYAAPEQIFGSQISTATDIYSLGVLLYELLAGQPPHDVGGRSAGEVMEMLRVSDPDPPSVAATLAAAVRRDLPDSARLEQTLRGELDAIVLMAMRKEPTRRYQSAAAFSDDLHAYLRGMPVGARGDTVSYRIGKLMRRRWQVVLGAAVGLLAMIAGTAVAVWQADAARDEARRAALVSSFLQSIIGAGDMSGESYGARLGPEASVSELLDSAAARVPTAFREDPRGGYLVHLAFGRALRTQERYENAAIQMDSAIALAERAYGPQSPQVAEALRELGKVESARGEYARAQDVLEQARRIYAYNGAERTEEGTQMLTQLAITKAMLGSYAPAESLLNQVMEIALARDKGPSVTRATALSHLSGIYMTSGNRQDKADSAAHAAVAMFDSIPNGDIIEKAEALWYEAVRELSHRNIARAESLSLVALAIQKRAAGPMSETYASHLANLAGMARARSDTAAARPYITEAMRVIQLRPESNPVARMRVQLEYVRFCLLVNDLANAERVAKVTFEEQRSGAPVYFASAQMVYGNVLIHKREYDKAEPLVQAAADYFLRTLPVSDINTQAAIRVAVALYDATGRKAEADTYRKQLVPAEPPK